MRFAVLSDVHANLTAFEAVLADMDEQGVDRALHLGDIVGYGPDPEECVNLMRARSIPSVLGNHEQAMLSDKAKRWFNTSSRKAVDITDSLISEETRQWLATLPTSIAFDRYRFVHGFPKDNAFFYLYQANNEKLEQAFSSMVMAICFVGHTHMLEHVEWDGLEVSRKELPLGRTRLNPLAKHILNVGSVGQPRDDFNYHAKYVLFDADVWDIEVRSVEYDYQSVARRIIARGIPGTYAMRLSGPGNL
ncbi:metallophosphoesterase family protein [Desulfovibrio ferrophilus]|uniref:Metallophosphoesterase n=1 Tax=Desulfovibrio ferrophilus TaxID=241368 RepID=A0A2Z6B310_9BACT|nr:metallophosphoesterase family protein [Desulfovibrio ferrophilus]BBD09800.1 metallophosphoesterase [Desulfovibrio ferrophilus]